MISDDIAFFKTAGTRLALYPLKKLAEDVDPRVAPGKGLSVITLGHNVRKKEAVAEVLAFAERAGGKIEKPAQDVFRGGHSGYSSDPDGYRWEVVWAPNVTLDAHGHIGV